MRKAFVGAAAAAAFLCAAGVALTAAAEYDPPSPASNFDAYHYRSPGGIGRPSRPSVYDADQVRPRDCGPNHRWVEGRCVDR
jgi:hypothetical protein